MKAVATILDKKGENAAQKVALMLEVLGCQGADAFCLATPNKTAVEASIEKLPAQEFKSSTALGHVFTKVLTGDTPKLTRSKKSAVLFDGRIYNPPMEDLKAFIDEKLQAGDASAIIEGAVKEFEGFFAFLAIGNDKLVVGRDSLGLYPVYYGENNEFFAVASERKALWRIGVADVKSLPPGHLLTANRRGFETRLVKAPRGLVCPISEEEAVEKLQGLLLQSITERTAGLNKVAVAFSGGLDSSLIAFLAKKANIEVHLIHVSLENQRETLQAEEAASLLDIPFHKFLYRFEDVENVLPKVLWCIEDPDPLKTSIAIPIFWAAEKAAELGFKILLVGQGADELFGGYRRYLNLCTRFGESAAEEAMVSDIAKMHEVNFERDFKVCSFHNIELRLPFASPPLVEFALSLPLNMKINPIDDDLRKLVLRKTAEKIGLPRQIAYKPKKAVQYATGVEKALKRLAKSQNLPLKRYLERIFKSTHALQF
ncbi:MAG: asparagine synthase-related protein [Candidatus Bathyarchaeia archaeon]